jgi:PAS domain S-box-containing protein
MNAQGTSALLELVRAFARGELDKRADVGDGTEPLHRLATGLNMLGAELEVGQAKQRETALTINEVVDRYQRLFEAAFDAVTLSDFDSALFLDANPSAIALFGYSLEELHSMKGRDVAFADGGGTEDFSVSLRREGIAFEEMLFQRKDGSTFWAEHSAAAFTTREGHKRIVGVTRDISDRKRLEQTRFEVIERVMTAQEEERRRISRELHDSLGQLLSSLAMQASCVSGDSEPEVITAALGRICKLSEHAVREVRALSRRLRPPILDELGLPQAAEEHARNVAMLHAIEISVQVVGFDDEERLPANIESALYRMLQEALTNVVKHAQATVSSVLIHRFSDRVRVVVDDDGVGFAEVRAGGLGLLGMRERAKLLDGDITIECTPGGGTTLYVEVPLPPPGAKRVDSG